MDSVHVTQDPMVWKSSFCMPTFLELSLHGEHHVLSLHAHSSCNVLQKPTFWKCGGAFAVLFPALGQAFLKGKATPQSGENPAGVHPCRDVQI